MNGKQRQNIVRQAECVSRCFWKIHRHYLFDASKICLRALFYKVARQQTMSLGSKFEMFEKQCLIVLRGPTYIYHSHNKQSKGNKYLRSASPLLADARLSSTFGSCNDFIVDSVSPVNLKDRALVIFTWRLGGRRCTLVPTNLPLDWLKGTLGMVKALSDLTTGSSNSKSKQSNPPPVR